MPFDNLEGWDGVVLVFEERTLQRDHDSKISTEFVISTVYVGEHSEKQLI